MLVLTRRVGEEIIIDGNIRVTVVRISGKKVLIGVTAPDTLRVDREERRSKLASEKPKQTPATHLPM